MSIWPTFGFGSKYMVHSTFTPNLHLCPYTNRRNQPAILAQSHETILGALLSFNDHDHRISLFVYRYFTVSIPSKLYDRGTPYFAQW